VYGETGSVLGKVFNPWYLRAAEVQCFSAKDRQFHQPLGEDADVFRLQIEDFALAIRTGEPLRGSTAADGVACVRGMVAIARAVESGDWVRLADVQGGL
jgi:predicted dehydrogenase